MILNVYKPKNWTSFDVVAKLRGVLKTKKIGHAGTLDPLAEGVLIVLTESDTKRQGEFMKLQKEYIAEIIFGAESPSYDLEVTPSLSANKANLDTVRSNLDEILKRYIGQIDQIVPYYSAVKVRGKPLYLAARKGKEITKLPTKNVTIYEIDILSFEEELANTDQGEVLLPVLKIKVICSSGTYIRSLAHDLGQDVDTGAVLKNLVRTRIGDYKVEDSLEISEVTSKLNTL